MEVSDELKFQEGFSPLELVLRLMIKLAQAMKVIVLTQEVAHLEGTIVVKKKGVAMNPEFPMNLIISLMGEIDILIGIHPHLEHILK